MTIQQGTTVDDKNLVIDNRLESYESFFDHSWARSLFQLVGQTKLDPLALDLCADWKGAANTFRLPWLMMTSLDSFKNGFMQTKEPFWLKLTVAFRDFLLKGVGTSLSNMKRKELIAIVDRLSQEVQDEIRRTPSPFQITDVWAEYVKAPEFVLSIWSSQRLCYGAVYFAYENFLRRCVEVGKAASNYRPKTRELQADLNSLMGSGLGDTCLADPGIDVARLVRHCLAHNGGRASPELSSKQHSLTVQDGMVHIMPDDTRRLFDLLKTRITLLVERAVAMPQYRI